MPPRASNEQRAKQARKQERKAAEERFHEHEEFVASTSNVPILVRLLGSRLFWTSRVTWTLILLSALANAGLWVWIALVLQPSSQQTVLHYTVQTGVDLIGPETDVWFFPVVAVVLFVVNVLFAALLYRFERFLSYALLAVSFVLQLVFFVGILTVSLATR